MTNTDTTVTPPKMCGVCGERRVAWTRPRVDFCYVCLPGGPFTPPPCRGCGSDHYYSNGLCVACHERGPQRLESCTGCLAWGVTRKYRSRCWSCRWWRTHYTQADCTACGRNTIVSEQRVCRLCWKTARFHQQPGQAVDLADATRWGQQLFFANMTSRQDPIRRVPYPKNDRSRRPADRTLGHNRPLMRLSEITDVDYTPVDWTQLALFDVAFDPDVVAARALGADSELMRYCDQIVRDYAAAHGWSRKHTNDVRRTLRLVDALHPIDSGKINASDVLKIPGPFARLNANALSTLDVLAAAGLLNDDRLTPVERYFNEQTNGLPDPMLAQLRVWLDVMINGSTVAPRRKPRDPATAKLHIRAIGDAARLWASQGHDSFAEITRDNVVAALPFNGPRRHTVEQGLRSLFRVLKARRLVFVNPTRGLPVTNPNATIPLPLNTDAIRAALNSPNPAVALAVALVGFHALTSRQLRDLELTDIVDGRLTIGDRVIPLAAPVLPRLAAWLDHRNATWPNTINAHLLINRRTAPRAIPVSTTFAWSHAGLAAQALREDRILDEVRATGGDVRRICELFDISVETALRYTSALGPTTPETPSS